jgi:hypothetical protein
MGFLVKGALAAVAAISVFPIVKDLVLYGRKTQLDQKIEKLIAEKGIFFSVPAYRKFRCGDGCCRERASVLIGKLTPFPLPLGLLAPKKVYVAKMEILWEPKTDQISGRVVATECAGKSAVDKSMSAKIVREGAEWGQDFPMEEVVDFCEQTLDEMRSISRGSKALGFKPASQKIMEESLRSFGAGRAQEELWEFAQKNQRSESVIAILQKEDRQRAEKLFPKS